MNLETISLFFTFLVQGIKAFQKFMADEQVRTAFKGLKDAKTDDEKEAVAKNIATLIYRN